MIKTLAAHKEFYPKLFSIAVPILLQNFVMSSLNFLDLLMIGQVGTVEVAAIGIASQIFFIFILFIFAIASGSSIFSAQYWGKRDVAKIKSILGTSLISSLFIALFFSFSAVLFPQRLIAVFSADVAVQLAGKDYLAIAGFSYIPTSLSFVYAFILRSTEKTRIPMLASVAATLTNTILNYVLIYGKWGFPALGVKGAALATVIARLIELSIILGASYMFSLATAARLHELLIFSREMVKKYLITVIPVLIQSAMWSIGTSIYSLVFARISTEAIAAYNVTASIEKICIMLINSLSLSCQIMVGNRLGAEEYDKAENYAKKFIILTVLIALLLSLILLAVRGPVVALYKISPQSIEFAYNLMLVTVLILWVKAMNIIFMTGIFKSGGDTRFVMLLDTSGVWLIGVPLAFISAFVLKLPVPLVAVFICTEELVKMAIAFIHFFSKKWMNNIVKENVAPSAANG